jgi:hypothetical protein
MPITLLGRIKTNVVEAELSVMAGRSPMRPALAQPAKMSAAMPQIVFFMLVEYSEERLSCRGAYRPTRRALIIGKAT